MNVQQPNTESPGVDYLHLLDQREDLDRRLHEMRQKVTVLFSDIVRYTKFVSQHGDVQGRLLQKRHETLVCRQAARRGGVFVKSIGDAVMMRFSSGEAAVETACAILKQMEKENQDPASGHRLQLRLGVATGRALLEENDVNGEVVNTAARLCKAADINGILICDRTYTELDDYLSGLCIPNGNRLRGGLPENTRSHRVLWNYEGPVRERSRAQAALVLNLQLSEGKLRQSLSQEGAGQETVRHFEILDWDAETVERNSLRITQSLKRATSVSGDSNLDALRDAGSALYDILFSARLKAALKQTALDCLILDIQDSLIFVPWELLYDGESFLCERFAIGRRVTSQKPARPARRQPALRPRLTIISDPTGDLPASRNEGQELTTILSSFDRAQVAMKSGAGQDYVRSVLRTSHIIHYCGHADYDESRPGNSGWLLADGRMTSELIHQMAESDQPLPLLVFSNACKSGRTQDWSAHQGEAIYDMASSFLLAGVQHYVGTLWDVSDSPSRDLALRFYENLLAGKPIGVALRDARRALLHHLGNHSLVWASYVLYGDPTLGIFGEPDMDKSTAPAASDADAGAEPVPEAEAPRTAVAAGASRSAETHRVQIQNPRRSVVPAITALALVLLVAAGLFLTVSRPPASSGGANSAGAKSAGANVGGADSGLSGAVPPDASSIGGQLALLSERLSDDTYLEALGGLDEWSSRPLTFGVLPLAVVEGTNVSPADAERIRSEVYASLLDADRIVLLDRENVDRALEELNIGSSALVRQENLARLGDLLFARYLMTGNILADDTGTWLSLRCFETETTRYVAAETLGGASAPAAIGAAAATYVASALRREDALRGRVHELGNGGAFLNIGKRHGVAPGMVFTVLADGDRGGDLEPLGQFEIEQVSEYASYGVPRSADVRLEKDLRLVAEAP